MKINNWCKKLSATLVATGLMMPALTHAAGVGVNLVVNGGFENVDLNVTGDYHSPKILNWTGPSLFAYSHDGSSSSTGVVPDYADGADPPAAGHWYFTANNTGTTMPTDVNAPNTFYQDIDLSTGAAATKIATGTATYSLSAWMSSYLNDPDYGNVQVEFRNASNSVLATALITDQGDVGPNNVWNQTSANGAVPVGTASARMSLWGVSGVAGRGGDGYIDNVDFRIGPVPEPTSATLFGVAAAAAARRRRREDA
jgi:hypothetical protein